MGLEDLSFEALEAELRTALLRVGLELGRCEVEFHRDGYEYSQMRAIIGIEAYVRQQLQRPVVRKRPTESPEAATNERKGDNEMSTYNLIQRLKAFDANRLDLDELVFLYAESTAASTAYHLNGLVVPEWLGDTLGKIEVEIGTRRRDQLAKELKMLEAEEGKLLTRQERRGQLAERRAEINRLLGRPQPVSQPEPVPQTPTEALVPVTKT